MKALIQKLVKTPGTSGYESLIRDVIRSEVEALVDHVRVDNLGNLIARKGVQTPDGIKVMLSAHIDEIGVMVTHIDENGFARFIPIGAVRPHTCPGGRVQFLNGANGVIGIERLNNPLKAPAFDEMYIDLGVTNHTECPVRVGDVATFDRPFLDMGNRLVSKAMDDRIGVAVLIGTLRQLNEQEIISPHQIDFVFSVQEEVGVRGATTAAFGVEPDLGLAVDVTGSGDTPKGLRMDVALGKGPAIKMRDQKMLADPRVVKWMVSTAEMAGIPYQLEVLVRGSTDARAIQLSRAGVFAGCLSIPYRYVHSPSEMVDYDDVQNSIRLMVELLRHSIVFD